MALAWFVCFPGTLRGLGAWFWKPVSAWLYMWHLLVIPATLVVMLFGHLVLWLGNGFGRIADLTMGRGTRAVPIENGASLAAPKPQAASLLPVTGPAVVYPTRRQVIAAAATFVPQAVLGGTLLVSAAQAGKFRIRRMSIALPQLPRGLDGVTIAHVSDTHVGRFVGVKELESIVAATAALKPDAVAFTGDLIDFNLADLPPAVAALRQLQKVAPLAICVGNHDLFEDGKFFRRKLRTAELGLMVDERMPLTVRGQAIEFLGLDWGLPSSPRADGLQEHMVKVLEKRGGGFPILLAHHPHAFDAAAAANIPLTLSGHTHGGQIMFTSKFGAGCVYKYWSGLYSRGDSRLVVSNGVGNWFPLRVNAPAEIVHLTLRSV